MKYLVNISSAIAIVIVLLASNACRESELNKSDEEIEINIDEKSRPLLNVSIEALIPIETSPDCLIGSVGKFKFFNHRFYIVDHLKGKSFFIFGEDGHLIKKIRRGKGPGEVLEPWTFGINKEDSTILLYDQITDLIINLDTDGRFITSQAHRGLYLMDFHPINRDTFLIYHVSERSTLNGRVQSLPYALYTSNFTKIRDLDIFLFGDKIAHGLASPVWYDGSEVLLTSPWDYNIYQLIGNRTKVRYHLNFGKYNFTPKEIEFLSSYELMDEVQKERKVGIINSIFKTTDFLVFRAEYGETSLNFFKSLKNGSTYCLNDCIDAGLIPYFKIWGVREDGLFYGLVEPQKLIEFQKSSGRFDKMNIQDIDNPYIIICSIKNP